MRKIIETKGHESAFSATLSQWKRQAKQFSIDGLKIWRNEEKKNDKVEEKTERAIDQCNINIDLSANCFLLP